MPEAIRRNFPLARHQLCLVHQARTICRDVRKCDRKKVSEDFAEVYRSPDIGAPEARLSAFAGKWERTCPNMVRKLLAREGLLTFMQYPEPLWRTIYTSNAIEGFNAKLKREARRRVIMNSEENAAIVITACCGHSRT